MDLKARTQPRIPRRTSSARQNDGEHAIPDLFPYIQRLVYDCAAQRESTMRGIRVSCLHPLRISTGDRVSAKPPLCFGTRRKASPSANLQDRSYSPPITFLQRVLRAFAHFFLRVCRQKLHVVGVAGEKHIAAIDKAHEARRAEVALHRSTT